MSVSNMPKGQNIFLEVRDEDEKKSIFRSLAHFKGDILSKTPAPEDRVLNLRALDLKKDELEAEVINDFRAIIPEGELILKFQNGSDNYLSMMKFKQDRGRLLLKWKTRLFRLQRRQHYRLPLPDTYKGKFKISEIAGKPLHYDASILDLSGGGCRIEVSMRDRSWKTSELIEGTIELVDRSPIFVSGQIRHVSPLKSKRSKISIGVKFLGLTEQSQNRLVAIVLDLYRELFTRK